MPRHQQVPFVDYFGNTVEVDMNLLRILEALRDFGVRTDYSCEEELPNRAYILAKFRTAWPLMKMIFSLYRQGKYSKSSRQFIRSMLRGAKEFDFRAFGTKKAEFRLAFSRDAKPGSGKYVLELCLSTAHGLRIAVRWPTSETLRFLRLLQETWELNLINNKKES